MATTDTPSTAILKRPAITNKELELLSNNGVPAISLHEACKACDDPCFDDDEDTHPDQVGLFRRLLQAGRTFRVPVVHCLSIFLKV